MVHRLDQVDREEVARPLQDTPMTRVRDKVALVHPSLEEGHREGSDLVVHRVEEHIIGRLQWEDNTDHLIATGHLSGVALVVVDRT